MNAVRTIFFIVATIYAVASTYLSAQTCTFQCPNEIRILAPFGKRITCNVPTVTLEAISAAVNLDYWWVAPQGDSLNGALLQADAPGYYKLFFQNQQTGRIGMKEVLVEDARIMPKIITLGGELTCGEPETVLHNAALPPNLRFYWQGPDGFFDNTASPVVNMPGQYVLHVTEPNSGCVVTDTTTVVDNRIQPIAQINVIGDLGCDERQIVLDGSNSSQGLEFVYSWWSEDGSEMKFTDGLQNSVARAGTYNLVVSNTLNGCSARATVTITDQTGASRK